MKGYISPHSPDQAEQLIRGNVPQIRGYYNYARARESTMKQAVRLRILAVSPNSDIREYYIYGVSDELENSFHCIECFWTESGMRLRLNAVSFDELKNQLLRWKLYGKKKERTVRSTLRHLRKKNRKIDEPEERTYFTRQYARSQI